VVFISSNGLHGTWNDVPNEGTPRPGNNADGPYFGIIEIPSCPDL